MRKYWGTGAGGGQLGFRSLIGLGSLPPYLLIFDPFSLEPGTMLDLATARNPDDQGAMCAAGP